MSKLCQFGFGFLAALTLLCSFSIGVLFVIAILMGSESDTQLVEWAGSISQLSMILATTAMVVGLVNIYLTRNHELVFSLQSETK